MKIIRIFNAQPVKIPLLKACRRVNKHGDRTFYCIFLMFISCMLIMPSFKKSLIVEQFQGNYLKCLVVVLHCDSWRCLSFLQLWNLLIWTVRILYILLVLPIERIAFNLAIANPLSKFVSPLISYIFGEDTTSVPGIIQCGAIWISFAVQFGDHLWYWDHLWAGIIFWPVQFCGRFFCFNAIIQYYTSE